MNRDIKKISKILDEIITFAFLHGTDKMNISIENQDELYKIHIEANNLDCTDRRVQQLSQLLDTPRQPEVEEYYWELTGECDTDTELCLVGIMVDKAEVKFNGNALTITLYRYK